ncbi:XrtX-associated membrane protein [Marinoscillum furvescens]|uniref:Uncharacterized protein n=1 Tax=Marinoscillum furvescens DSM 4134 TaxID=1122208 RepID=A0A3D9L985_MARFU|nr:hypothetical protein [Marinoscillum furvescens]REE01622.1 hypothetical protein C7460_103139 [Marinoscillum furvescens DSM 4134]
MKRNTYATVVLVLILVFGFFKLWVMSLFSNSVYELLYLVGVKGDLLRKWLNEFRETSSWEETILGWFIYYPLYFFLHIAFIFLLFRYNRKVRNWVALGLTVVVSTLVLGSVVGKLLDWEMMYVICYQGFQKLFGLPFILLAIEGGRILYNDVMGTELGKVKKD